MPGPGGDNGEPSGRRRRLLGRAAWVAGPRGEQAQQLGQLGESPDTQQYRPATPAPGLQDTPAQEGFYPCSAEGETEAQRGQRV